MDLAQKLCVACEGGTAPLNAAEAAILLAQVPGWSADEHGASITRSYRFKDFAEALAFANRIGAVAEEQGHHPDITLGWGKVGVSLTTHAIGGLSENDFIMAARIDSLG